MKKYLKTFVKWELFWLVALVVECSLVKALGVEPEYVPIAFGLTPIFAALFTWGKYKELTQSKD